MNLKELIFCMGLYIIVFLIWQYFSKSKIKTKISDWIKLNQRIIIFCLILIQISIWVYFLLKNGLTGLLNSSVISGIIFLTWLIVHKFAYYISMGKATDWLDDLLKKSINKHLKKVKKTNS